MTETQSVGTPQALAEAFSEQVDGLLVGQTPSGDDPLLSLAAEMVVGPAIDPSLAFRQRLRRRLLSSLARQLAVRPHRQWSFAGVAVTVLLALALTLIWNPRALSVAEVLARAADAIAVTSGQIVYVVSQVQIEGGVPGLPGIGESVITENWDRSGATPDGRLIPVEGAGAVYEAGDAELTQPVYWMYFSPAKLCIRSLDSSIPRLPSLDGEGCAAFNASAGGGIDPMAIYAGERFRDWISRMRANVEEIEFREDRFNDRPVYNLTYRERGHQIQFPTTVNHTATITVVARGAEFVPTDLVTYTVTLYIDRETYLPVGVISRDLDSNMVFTQIVLDYQVLDPEDLEFDPFTWPPER